MSINFSTASRIVKTINNPSLPVGTLVEEIPADIGRSAEGYKRGGVLEGAEKMRKELMSGFVWMFGIPAFKKAGDLICEKILKIPMSIDYSNAQQGNDAVKNSVEYLTGVAKHENFDASELKKYGKQFEGMDVNTLVKKVKCAKKITSIAAVVLNCTAMGIILPKINQKITSKKLQEAKENEKNKEQNKIFNSFSEFQNNTKPKNKNISFKGLADNFVYNVENNNVFRLIATDIPMIGGRVATSRNKYEGLEYVVMDGLSIYCYNFSANHIQKGLRKLTGTPNITPTIAELLEKVEPETLKEIFESDLDNCTLKVEELIKDKKLADEIYKEATYGRYGKINRFVKDSELKETDKSIVNFLNYIKKQGSEQNPIIKDGKINQDLLSKAIKNTNRKNFVFLALGLGASILGLAVLIPKFTFWITRQLTGKNEFSGIADYSDNKKENRNIS